MKFNGSKTEKNLLAAFAGESQARKRYSFFASAAKKEGYEQIAAIFLQTAEEEKEHGKIFFKQLRVGMLKSLLHIPRGSSAVRRRTSQCRRRRDDGVGHTLSPVLRQLPIKRGSRRSPPCSGRSRGSSSTTKPDIKNSWPTSRRQVSSNLTCR